MPIGDLAFLLELIERATQPLAGVAKKRLFGCDALFVHGSIFALIWKEGRIGLKFPDPAISTSKLSTAGARPWAPSGKAMSGWVLVPETFHDDEDTLAAWARESHALVRATAGSAPKPKAKSSPKAKAMAKSASIASARAKATTSPKPKSKSKSR